MGESCLGLLALLLSTAHSECPHQTPFKTRAGEFCSYQWTYGNFTCESYCCNPDKWRRGAFRCT